MRRINNIAKKYLKSQIDLLEGLEDYADSKKKWYVYELFTTQGTPIEREYTFAFSSIEKCF
jgi:hypothetical protein